MREKASKRRRFVSYTARWNSCLCWGELTKGFHLYSPKKERELSDMELLEDTYREVGSLRTKKFPLILS